MKAPNFSQEVIETGIDALTITAQDRRRGKQLVALSDRYIIQERNRGNERRPFKTLGVHGFSCGAITAGCNDSFVLVRLTSHLAREAWRDFYRLSDNCSRIDFQQTIRTDADVDLLIAQAERLALNFRASHKKAHDVTLLRSARSGSTLTLGKRISDVYTRIYNKHRETKLEHYKGCYRVETEYKKRMAGKLASELSRRPLDGELVAATLAGRLAQTGLRSYAAPGSVYVVPYPMTRPDKSRRLDWWLRAVRKPLETARADGYLDEALRACGCTADDLRLVLKLWESKEKEKKQHGAK